MDVAHGCLRNFHNDQARAGAAVPLRLTAASTGPLWDRPNGPRCAAAPYCRNLCLSCYICSLGAQALDCRYRGNPPVLTLMADMTFECTSTSPDAIPPEFLRVSPGPLSGGSSTEMWMLHIFGAIVFIGM